MVSTGAAREWLRRPGTTGIVSGLSCGTNYTLGIDASDAAGNRSAQAVVMVATTACVDTYPDCADRPVYLEHHTDCADGRLDRIHGQRRRRRVQRRPERYGRRQPTTPSTTVSGLTCGTSYTIGVTARDAAGNVSARTTTQATASACALPPTSGAPVTVSRSGNDSTCIRGDSTKPCASFDRAYEIAQLGRRPGGRW